MGIRTLAYSFVSNTSGFDRNALQPHGRPPQQKENASMDLYFKVKEKSNTLRNYRSNHGNIDW